MIKTNEKAGREKKKSIIDRGAGKMKYARSFDFF